MEEIQYIFLDGVITGLVVAIPLVYGLITTLQEK